MYPLQTAFSIEQNTVQPTPGHVFAIISMVFWSIAILVSVEYVALVMRADRAVRRGSPRPLQNSSRYPCPCVLSEYTLRGGPLVAAA